ncbi:MAG: type 4a pilus biogenesis protein PilO [Nitrospiria bacterium]
MPEKSVHILFFIVLSGAAVVSCYYSFVTMEHELIRLESGLTKQDRQPFRFEADVVASPAPQERVKALFVKAVPERPHLPQAVHALSLRAKRAGLRNVSLVAGERTEADVFFRGLRGYQWPVTVRFEGRYLQLARFIHGIETLERAAEITGLSFVKGKAGISAELKLLFYSQTAPPPFSKPEQKDKTDAVQEDGEEYMEEGDAL